MKLTRTRMLAVVVAAALAVALVVALVLGSWRWSVALTAVMVILVGAAVILVVRRSTATVTADLERMERKIDHLALRVVTESQATHRELSGLIEELGSTLHQKD
jgi:membrane protein implicated in regulation of membrane protease activity